MIRKLPVTANEKLTDKANALIKNGLKLRDIEVTDTERKTSHNDSIPGVVIAKLKSMEDNGPSVVDYCLVCHEDLSISLILMFIKFQITLMKQAIYRFCILHRFLITLSCYGKLFFFFFFCFFFYMKLSPHITNKICSWTSCVTMTLSESFIIQYSSWKAVLTCRTIKTRHIMNLLP